MIVETKLVLEKSIEHWENIIAGKDFTCVDNCHLIDGNRWREPEKVMDSFRRSEEEMSIIVGSSLNSFISEWVKE